jgi:hypothetical protein
MADLSYCLIELLLCWKLLVHVDMVTKRFLVKDAHLHEVLHILLRSLLQMLRGFSEVDCSA